MRKLPQKRQSFFRDWVLVKPDTCCECNNPIEKGTTVKAECVRCIKKGVDSVRKKFHGKIICQNCVGVTKCK